MSGRSSGHRSGGQTSVIGSTTESRWLRESRREQALRVVGGDRQVALARPAAGEHARAPPRSCGRRRSSPCGTRSASRGERGERREAAGVDPVARVHQRGGGQLVEDDHHDRRARARLARHRLRPALRQHELGDRRDEQEEDEEEQRRRRDDGDERADGRGARVERREAGAREQRDRHGDRRAAEQVADRRQQDRRREQADEHELQGVAERGPDLPRQPDEQREQRRRHERDDEREHDDVGGRAPARDEELRLVAEQVEQRLREGERPEGGEMQGLYARGRAS